MFVSVPLRSATVTKYNFTSLGYIEVVASGCHLTLPGSLIHGESSDAEA
jgi:hypothetical protein